MTRKKKMIYMTALVTVSFFILGCEERFDMDKFKKRDSITISSSQEDSDSDRPRLTLPDINDYLNPDGSVPGASSGSEVSPDQLPLANWTMGTIGDSISRAFNSDTAGGDDSEYNWSSGEALSNSSHVHRLRQLASSIGRSLNLSARNEAAIGAEVIDAQDPPLEFQALSMANFRPEYVTILIGGNDLCNARMDPGSFKSQFKQKVKNALTDLQSGANPPRLILVSSIPDIVALKSTPGLTGTFRCQAAWQIACKNFQDMSSANLRNYWVIANEALEEAVNEVGGTALFDNYRVANTSFSESDVTLDCFHPSKTGQRKIADTLWTVVEPYLEAILRQE